MSDGDRTAGYRGSGPPRSETMLREETRERLQELARRLQLFGAGLSALLGGFVGSLFAIRSPMAWGYAFGGYLCLLFAGMTVVVLSAVSERVTPNDWRAGVALSCRIFFAHTTVYALMVLGLGWVIPYSLPRLANLDVATLAVRMLPGLYISAVMAIVLSGPLYLRWLAAPEK